MYSLCSMYELKQTHRCGGQTCSCQAGGKDWELGISRCKALRIGWISNKVLLRSTAHYINYILTVC